MIYKHRNSRTSNFPSQATEERRGAGLRLNYDANKKVPGDCSPVARKLEGRADCFKIKLQ